MREAQQYQQQAARRWALVGKLLDHEGTPIQNVTRRFYTEEGAAIWALVFGAKHEFEWTVQYR